MVRIRKKERDAILSSISAGVTPQKGLQHIQVGRDRETKALIEDIERVKDGGSCFRLIIGEFGAGKTFFLHLVKAIALEKNLVVANADLNPDRRIHATGGQSRSLYRELMRNVSTKTRMTGNALQSVVEKLITDARAKSKKQDKSVSDVIGEKLQILSEYVGGYDLASAVEAYWKGYEHNNEELKQNAIRWLRAEFSTKTEAKNANLGVGSIIDDSNFYDSLKLFGLLCRQAGFSGFLVCLDELVNLYKLSHTRARNSNYEQILRMLNDCLQGTAEHFGILLGGTPEFLLDARKGLYSYEALQSRLSENKFSIETGIIDYNSPTLHLNNLSKEDMFILLRNIRDVFAMYERDDYLVSEDQIELFMQYCDKQIGSAYFKTPRNSIKAFSDLLSLLDQNPSLKFESLISEVKIEEEKNIESLSFIESDENDDEELTSFQL